MSSTGGAHPVVVYDRYGAFVSSWGEGLFRNAHGIHIGPDDSVWMSDSEAHVVMKFSPEGKLLMTLGNRDRPSNTYRGAPFNMPTNVAVAPTGEIYVSDGYGNKRVHKFSPEGELLLTWGDWGKGPAQFSILHSLAIDSRGRIYVCDRHNNRIQVLDGNGKYVSQWEGLHAPSDISIVGDLAYVTEQGPSEGGQGPDRVGVWSLDGKLLSWWGAGGAFVDPHGVWADANGDVYVADVVASQVFKFARAG